MRVRKDFRARQLFLSQMCEFAATPETIML